MDVTEFRVDAAAVMGTVLVLATVRWAATERARAHRLWKQHQHQHGGAVIDWCMATCAVVGVA